MPFTNEDCVKYLEPLLPYKIDMGAKGIVTFRQAVCIPSNNGTFLVLNGIHEKNGVVISADKWPIHLQYLQTLFPDIDGPILVPMYRIELDPETGRQLDAEGILMPHIDSIERGLQEVLGGMPE